MINALVSFTELDAWGEVYNIGYGKNWSVQEIADLISSHQVHLSARPGEMRETLADIGKACSELMWKPKVSVLEWIKNQLP